MSHSRCKFIALVLTAALALTACSDDDGANNGTATNNGQGDVTEDTQQALDAAGDVTEEDAGSDTSETDTSETDTGPSETLWLPDFSYTKPDQGSGVSVNVIAGLIGKIENSHERTEDLTDQEIETLKAEILTEATRDKMIDGWDCGDATEVDGTRWIFEGRVLIDPDTRERQEITLNVSGCAAPDSTEPDAERVQEIIQHLDDLRGNHFLD